MQVQVQALMQVQVLKSSFRLPILYGGVPVTRPASSSVVLLLFLLLLLDWSEHARMQEPCGERCCWPKVKQTYVLSFVLRRMRLASRLSNGSSSL